jgi:hypothetical protein
MKKKTWTVRILPNSTLHLILRPNSTILFPNKGGCFTTLKGFKHQGHITWRKKKLCIYKENIQKNILI